MIDREAWLKSPDIRISDCGREVCSCDTVVCMSSQAVVALAERGIYTAIAIK